MLEDRQLIVCGCPSSIILSLFPIFVPVACFECLFSLEINSNQVFWDYSSWVEN